MPFHDLNVFITFVAEIMATNSFSCCKLITHNTLIAFLCSFRIVKFKHFEMTCSACPLKPTVKFIKPKRW